MSKSQIRIPGRRRRFFFLGFEESKLQGRGSIFFLFLLLGYEIISRVFWIFRGISKNFNFFQPCSFLRTERFDFITSTESIESSRELDRVCLVLSSYTEFQPIPCLSRIWCRYLSVSRLRISRVVSDSVEFLNPDIYIYIYPLRVIIFISPVGVLIIQFGTEGTRGYTTIRYRSMLMHHKFLFS